MDKVILDASIMGSREDAANNPIKVGIKNLNLYYGKFQALKDINMDIEEKKVTALIGPSGCG